MKMGAFLLGITAATVLLASSCQTVANHPPVISGVEAEPKTVFPLQSCRISCHASDPDGDVLNYRWSAPSGQIHEEGAAAIWIAPESEGLYNIAVTVSDEKGNKTSDYVTVVVRANNAPYINTLVAAGDWVIPSSSLEIRCYAEDPERDELTYYWSTSGGNISGSGSQITWTAPQIPGMYNVTVTVKDAYGGADTRSVTITVAPDSPPLIENLIVTADHRYLKKANGSYLIGKEKNCWIECFASSPWGGQLIYVWSATGGEIETHDSRAMWIAPNLSGQFTVTVTVSDFTGNRASKSIIFKVVACSPCTFG
jgi:hypothetical protein